MKIDSYKIITYDFEVCYANQWICDFYDSENNTHTTVNTRYELLTYFENNKDCIFVGFNNKYYDNWILRGIYANIYNLYGLNNEIVNQGKSYFTYFPDNEKFRQANDWVNKFVFYDIHQTYPSLSLKKAEANMGLSIIENESIMKKSIWTPEDFENIKKYCQDDTEATFKLLVDSEKKESTLLTKFLLLKKFNKSLTFVNKTLGNIGGIIFDAHRFSEDDVYGRFTFNCPNCIKQLITSKELLLFYENLNLGISDKKRRAIKLGECVGHQSIGGLHLARKNYQKNYVHSKEILVYLDAKQMYLNIMANKNNPELHFAPRNFKDWTSLSRIGDLRDEARATNNEPLAEAIKKAGNTIFGTCGAYDKKTLRPKNEFINDWIMNRTICCVGQCLLISLYDQINLVVKNPNYIQFNTDGIYLEIMLEDLDNLQMAVKKWESLIGIKLPIGIIQKGILIQRDVNSYILRDDEGHIKAKGSPMGNCTKNNYGDFASNTYGIISYVLEKHLLDEKPIQECIQQAITEKRWSLFQKIISFSADSIKGNVDEYGNQLQKVNRVFASTNTNLPKVKKKVTKVLKKTGDEIETLDDYGNVPPNCYIFNNDLKYFNIEDCKLDINFYVDLINDAKKKFLSKKGGK